MPRNHSYWNNIPLRVVGGARSHRVLKAWGLTPWGARMDRRFVGECDYVGWQRVHLPEGWTISLESYDLFLLDDKDRVRGRIHDALERKFTSPPIFLDIDLSKVFTPAEIKRMRKPKKGPSLELCTAVSLHDSFSLGNTLSVWVENPFGERIFSLHDVVYPGGEGEYEKKYAETKEEALKWLVEFYPRWKSPYFYWDRFV